MSQENVELVKSIYSEGREYTAFVDSEATEGKLAEWRPRYHPEYEFHAVVERDRLVEHGLDGYLGLMRDWLRRGRATQSPAMSSTTLSPTEWQ